MSKPPIRVLDLFAGAGGLTAGFEAADSRFRSVGAVEFDAAAAASYEATFGTGIVYAGPIQDWLQSEQLPKDIDVIVGGPPCQGFSTLNRQRQEDERNALWEHYAATIERTKPKYFVVENVGAFARSQQYQQFVEETSPTGSLAEYSFEHRILNAADYGTPQARKRTVILGHHRDVEAPEFPEPTHGSAQKAEAANLRPYVTVRDTIGKAPFEPDRDHLLLERDHVFEEQTFAGTFTSREMHWSRNYSDLSRQRFREIPTGGNRFDLPKHLLAPCWVNHRTGSGDVMGRLHWDKPSVTIRTEFFKPEKGRYLHPEQNRAITHYEAALLQGFTPNHQFVGSKTAIARQIGNAVPLRLGAAIARQIAARF